VQTHLNAIGMNGGYRLHLAACEICGGKGFSPLQELGRIGAPGVYGPLPVKACGRCGFVMINPRYERRFYVEYYRKLYRRVATGTPVPTVEYLRRQTRRGERIRLFLQPFAPADRRMLDIGCSAGATMIPFLRKGWSCVGVDPDGGAVRVGRQMLRLPVRTGSAEELPFRKGEFGLVLSLGTFEHVHDLGSAMRRCRRTLRDGGLLLMRTRSHAMWGSPLEYYNHNHTRYFSERTLRLALLRFGFEPVRFTAEPLEGIPGTFYTLSRAARPVPLRELLTKIDAGMRDDAGDLGRRLRSYAHRYETQARGFLSLVESCAGDPGRIARAVRAGKNRFTILDGPVKEAVRRAELEARLFLAQARPALEEAPPRASAQGERN
jgi:SAM-dependent methyltransferase